MTSPTHRLLLCSSFSDVAPALGEEFRNKRVVFIPTAADHEEYTGYVDSARRSWEELRAEITELDITNCSEKTTIDAFEKAEIIYLSGGNSFHLIDQLRTTGVDHIIKEQLTEGKTLVGESAGAIVCSPDLEYIQSMDSIPGNYGQTDYTGMNLVDFFVVPHYRTPPFVEASEQVATQYSALPLQLLNNNEAVLVHGNLLTKITAEPQ